mmetsp:Transcript_30729/g.40815  ORF Transcript_30729/g.40815 Transcript_30729/m.40815 type:complete len:338 (+) Transcript_30729:73-1086(+)
MVYLEHSGSRFWRCAKTAPRTVITSYGKCGFTGRTIKKTDFKNRQEADDYVSSQEATKRNCGYIDATDPSIPPNKGGGKSSGSSSSSSSSSKKKASLKSHSAPDLEDQEEEMTVDSGLAEVDAALSSRVVVHETLHARLALVDHSKNSDKYYILQVLVDGKKKKIKKGGSASKTGLDYYLFTRWGRTGTGGQCNLEGPFVGGENHAEKGFSNLFKSKTGVEWAKAVRGAPPKTGKYEYLESVSKGDKDASWYYYLTLDPFGKADGWYEYDKNNANEVESLYLQYVASKHVARLSARFIHSTSSGYTYKVNLGDLTQTNTNSGKARPIKRTTTGKPPS